MNDEIKIINAKENNLKNINLIIPKNQLIVFTGLSGSGKSTLAFNTLYAEGQRRYVESLSAYARQFLDKFKKPDVEKIEGLTPAIAIDQKSTSKNPRSTVGTITEIYDYLRLLYSRIGTQHCYKCGEKISQMTKEDITIEILKHKGQKAILYAPLVNEKKGTFLELFEKLIALGYIRVSIDGVMCRLDEEINLSKTKKHTIKLVLDRFEINNENLSRISSAVEKGLELSYGELELELMQNSHKIHYSLHNACFDCKISYPALEPLSFSFNSPKGACKDCDGLGIRFSIDINKIIDDEKSIENGAIKTLSGFNKSYYSKFLKAFCEHNNINEKIPYKDLSDEAKRLILYGNMSQISFTWKHHKITKTYEGAIKISYDMLKDDKDLNEYVSEKKCQSCNGFRLNPSSLAVRVLNQPISWVINTPISEICKHFDANNFTHLNKQEKQISTPILKEINERLYFLNDVGLGYLTLGRDARTISGGEAQRIRIASQIGSGLSGVMYVLDEPSIGLHEKDTHKLIKTLKSLQEKGNTLIVVEHDRKTIESADFIVDIGPKAGEFGGKVVFSGTPKELLKSKTLTAQYLTRQKEIDIFKNRKQLKFLEISDVNINNIENLSVKIPLSNLVAITGVSGSGKSSLILQTLLPLIKTHLGQKVAPVNATIKGVENIDKIIYLDQSPIGRTPRSNPATYTGVMDDIREIFASTQGAKMRGYKVGRFSFNVPGGRCEKCSGDGEIKISMHFLPDVNVVCDNCGGKRYNAATLEVLFNEKNIADVLSMSVKQAYDFFKKIPKIEQKLKTLIEVGLEYITLGQNATTLSGGEAQRVKLAKELSKKDSQKTLYILDEPTTGLHFDDSLKLLKILHRLVDKNNSVVVIEHNLDIIKCADYLIDMGPNGGSGGGKIVDCGTPIEVAKRYQETGSFTGEYLAKEYMEMNMEQFLQEKTKKSTKKGKK